MPERLAALRRFCEERGWIVVAEYADKGISGGTVQRTQFQAMLKRALSKEKPFDLVLMRDASRFGRGDEDPAVRAKLREAGVSVDNIEAPSSPTFGDEPLTAGQKMAERFKWVMDVGQREEVAPRIISSLKRVARQGGLPGRQGTVFGYRAAWVADGLGKPRRKVELHPDNAKIVSEMFRRYLETGSIKAVTAWLNASAIQPPGLGKRSGLQWYDTTVRGILTNESLLGRVVYGRIRKEKIEGSLTGAKRNVKNVSGEIIRTDGVFPAVVDQAIFDKVQAKLAKNERNIAGGGNPGNSLRGIGKCYACNWHLAHQRNTSNERWYYMCGRVKTHKAPNCDPRCVGIIYAEYVDEVVEMFVGNTVRTPGYEHTLRDAIKAYNAAAADFKGIDVFASLDATISDLSEQVKNLTVQVARTGSDSLTNALVETEAKLADVRKRRAEIAANVIVEPIDELATLRAAKKMKTALRLKDREQMVALLPELVSSIEVDWSKRKKAPIGFNYRLGTMTDFDMSPRSEPLPRFKDKKLLNEAKARAIAFSEEAAVLNASETTWTISLAPSGVDAKIDYAGAPLTFIAKWDLTNLNKISEEAVERIGKVLSS